MAKPFLTYDEQIDKLINEKHLQIVDTEYAKAVLKNIGYFSLIGGYKTPFINTMTRIYKKNVSFEDVFALYQFDLSLRELVFQYLCQIECKIRQLVSYSFCSKHGEQQNAYLNPNNYNNSRKNASDIAYLIQLLTYHATRNNEHKYLVHQRNVYHNVPLWVLVNALTYGQISKFYALLPFRIQIDFPDTVLHEKLGIAKKGNQYLLGKRDLFGLVVAFRYLLSRQDFLEFKREIIHILRKYMKSSSQISENSLLSMMGFPSNWKNITRYRI